MSAPVLNAYVFSTQDQWASCLTAGLSPDGQTLTGLTPLGRSTLSNEPARLVARLANGELIWIDAAGHLYTEPCGDIPASEDVSPGVLAGARRLVSMRGALWALGEDGDLCRVSPTRFQMLDRFTPATLGAQRILDVASDGRDEAEVLIADAAGTSVARWRRRDARFHRQAIAVGDAARLAVLGARSGEPRLRVVLLADALRYLPEGKAAFDVVLGALGAGLQPTALASDGRDRIFLAAVTPVAAGWRRSVFVLDRQGEVASTLDLGVADQAAWAPGLAAGRQTVWIADDTGLTAFAPDPQATSSATLITPLLVSPELAERGWLRAEIEAELPIGAHVTVSQASTSDPASRNQWAAVRSNPTLSPGQRRQQLEQLLDGLWTISADADIRGDEPARFIAPLYAAQGAALLLKVEITYSGSAPTRLRSLRVLYPQLSLMRWLPAIYSRPTGDGDGFLRALVAVLEATTQDLNTKIEGLASLIDPQTAPVGWLDFLASWFGLPWHQDLPADAKRALLRALPTLLRTRGTRAGLEGLFTAILPGALVSLIDTTVDYRPTVLAGRGAGGVRLPAVLLGRPPQMAGLGEARARLGRMRLACPADSSDPFAILAGRVRLVVALSADARLAWEPILRALVPDFIPAGLTLDLRWRGATTEGLGRRLDADLRLAGRVRAVLGAGLPLGRTVLGGEGVTPAGGALAGGLRLN